MDLTVKHTKNIFGLFFFVQILHCVKMKMGMLNMYVCVYRNTFKIHIDVKIDNISE